MLGTHNRPITRASARGLSGGSTGYRDVTGQGGYVYRVYEDGRIQILQSPRGGAGAYVQPGSAAYNAILEEAYSNDLVGVSGQSRGRRVKADDILTASERIVGVADTGTKIAERIAALARGQSPASSEAYVPAESYLPAEPEASGPPWGLILGAGGVLLGIGVLAFAFGGGD